MKDVKIGIIGFGNVGTGFVQALQSKRDSYKKHYGLNFLITGIVDLHKGCIYNRDGIRLESLLNDAELSQISDVEHPNWNPIAMIHQAETDVIIELSYTNLETGEPAVLHVREAILSGKHVITSNKGPIALHYKLLKTLAQQNNVKLGIEGTVMSGTPALRLGSELLFPAGINAIRGIVNGTCNFILTEMEKGMSFDDALLHAQELGYAEADPSGDVEGLDSAGKAAILSQLIFDQRISPMDVECSGITDITPEDIKAAAEQNCRWKLIASVKRVDTDVTASVRAEMIPMSNPLSNVMGAANAIQYETDLLGQVTLIGAGAGRIETAAAIIEDLIAFFA